MRQYELTISEGYVPNWGVVEAVREFFQNALDEEIRDPNNTMFYTYDFNQRILRIGNKHGILDPKTLLFGYTDKNDQDCMIGNHGEGYKIATVVLLREHKKVTIYNYGCRQVWKPRFVNSRRYGAKVPTFFVEDKHFWEVIPDNDLVIEIEGITQEEYDAIWKSNLHLQGKDNYEYIETRYGDIILDDEMRSKIFVGGLYICSDERLTDFGLDFHPDVVRIERDRSMVDGFDVQWYSSKMISESCNIDLIEQTLPTYAGRYISSASLGSYSDEIAKRFLEKYGLDAVPVANQKEARFLSSTNIVVVSEQEREIIVTSEYYIRNSIADKNEDLDSLYNKLRSFGLKLSDIISENLLDEYSNLIREVGKLENEYAKSVRIISIEG